jgi:Rod binding domain-containing protein
MNLPADFNALSQPLQNTSRPSTAQLSPELQQQQESIREAAHDFEAAFITQMLTFSGLGKALTTGGGEAMSAFTGFYIESFAEQMTEAGGLGLAERFYTDLLQTSGLADAVELSSPERNSQNLGD